MSMRTVFTIGLVVLAGSAYADENRMISQSIDGGMAPARDGDIAIQQEFEAAIKDGSYEALDLFIRRHPDHRLTPEAKKRLDLVVKDECD